MTVLSQKPHKENITNIDNFIWSIRVSYCRLNAITKPSQFPIPRCNDATFILGDGAGNIWIISLDERQGYHQIVVCKEDQEKLAFFAPDDRKYTFNAMPFGPTNTPVFYTTMMKDLKDEWDELFIIRLVAKCTFLEKDTVLSAADVVTIGRKRLLFGSKTIIDDILLWCDVKELTIIYFRSVCEVFQKYSVSFHLGKCEFLKPQVKYVGYDILRHGNSPASSKFNIINDWPQPTSGQFFIYLLD